MTTSNAPVAASPRPLGDHLRRLRRARGLSQQALCARMGVSQRHVSFLECGRSRPGFRLLTCWLDICEAPAAQRAALLELAGFGLPAAVRAIPEAAGIGSHAAESSMEALQLLLHAQDGVPAYVLDAGWNILAANGCGHWLAGQLTPKAAELVAGRPVNLVDLLDEPAGLRDRLVNPHDVVPTLLARARMDGAADPRLLARVDRLHARSALREDGARDARAGGTPVAPLLSRFRAPVGELAFLSILLTYGWPLDIVQGSLRIEYLVPADTATRACLRAHAGPAGAQIDIRA